MRVFLLILLAILIAVLVITGMTFASVYNGLVTREEAVSGAWAQVENVYQRRADLVPSLVEAVKGYAAHEKTTLQDVVEARARIAKVDASKEILNDPLALAKFQEAQTQMSAALSRLLVVVEQYPDLKASQNFLAFQSQLEGTENRITVERRRFNEAAQGYNAFRRVFPNSFVAQVTGFKNKSYFQADQDAKTAPLVKF